MHPNSSCICSSMKFHWINNYLDKSCKTSNYDHWHAIILIKVAKLVIMITGMQFKGHNSVKIQNTYTCKWVFSFLPFSHQFALVSCFLKKLWQQYLFIWNSSNYVLWRICWKCKNRFQIKMHEKNFLTFNILILLILNQESSLWP